MTGSRPVAVHDPDRGLPRVVHLVDPEALVDDGAAVGRDPRVLEALPVEPRLERECPVGLLGRERRGGRTDANEHEKRDKALEQVAEGEGTEGDGARVFMIPPGARTTGTSRNMANTPSPVYQPVRAGRPHAHVSWASYVGFGTTAAAAPGSRRVATAPNTGGFRDVSHAHRRSPPARPTTIPEACRGRAALAATPAWTRAPSKLGLTIGELSDRRDFLGTEDEAFWEMVKSQFPLRPGLILMNAANLCPSPYPVQEAVFGYTRDIDQDASFHNRAKFNPLAAKSVDALAGLLAASPEEIVITRNTSESNNAVINGLTLGAGDEVVLWDQNHPTNNVAWDVRADRWGYKVIRVTTPPAPKTEDELIDAFVSAFTDRTRVLSVTQISNISGVELPASRLCGIARDRGIYVHMDGAQSFGAVEVDLHAMGVTRTRERPQVVLRAQGSRCALRAGRPVAELWPSVVGRRLGRGERRGRGRQVRHVRAAGTTPRWPASGRRSSFTRRSGPRPSRPARVPSLRRSRRRSASGCPT